MLVDDDMVVHVHPCGEPLADGEGLAWQRLESATLDSFEQRAAAALARRAERTAVERFDPLEDCRVSLVQAESLKIFRSTFTLGVQRADSASRIVL